MRVLGYCRISVDEPKSCSIEAQQEQLRSYCQQNGLELVDILIDRGLSARNTDRPGLQRALALLEEGAAFGLIVTRLDRLTRSLKDGVTMLEKYFQSRFSLHSISERLDNSPQGRFCLALFLSFFQLERETIGMRTANALRYRRETLGIHVGRAPIGFRIQNGKLVKDEAEQTHIALALSLRAAGKTLEEIAREFTARAIPSKRGGKWHASTIRSLLTRNQSKGGDTQCLNEKTLTGAENERDRGENDYLRKSA